LRTSAREEYGLRCLITIARRGGETTIAQMSEIEGMTESHVAKTLAVLRNFGYIGSTRGKLGGYRLTSPPDKILIADVLSDLGGRIHDDEFCSRFAPGASPCHHESRCNLNVFWQRLQSAVDDAVGGMTLADLAFPDSARVVMQAEAPVSHRAAGR
jgi:Rrf2 family protein